MTLNGIRACEVAGVVPSPLWSKGNCLYWEQERGSNAWDYYFEPLKARDEEVARNKIEWAFKPLATMITPCYDGMDVRGSYAEIIRRHVRVRGQIAEKIDAFVLSHFGDEAPLGCHMRFTDVSAEIQRAASLEVYWQAIDEYLDNHAGRIFIATDCEQAIRAAARRYGSRVIYQEECIRSSDGRSLHGHYDSGIDASPYQKGIDVLLDALLLSKCAHLIGIHSMVSRFSFCVNELQTQHMLGGQPLW